MTAIYHTLVNTIGHDPARLVELLILGLIALFVVSVVYRFARRKPAATATTGAAASGLTPAAMEELERAQALLTQQAITPLEYERMKAKILGL
jgi:hypothetical protein